MARNTLLMQFSTDRTHWIDAPQPSEYAVKYEDVDNDSYRSVANGNLIRRRISKKWIKLELKYYTMSADDLNRIAPYLDSLTFYVRCKTPALGNWGGSTANNPTSTGTADWVVFRAYCTTVETELLKPMSLGYSVSFNIIQHSKGSWN